MKDRNGNDLKVGDRVLVAGKIVTSIGGRLTVELDEPDAQKKRRNIEVDDNAVDLRDVPEPGEARVEDQSKGNTKAEHRQSEADREERRRKGGD